jgi:hypothetical protein
VRNAFYRQGSTLRGPRLRAAIALVLSVCMLASVFHGWSAAAAEGLAPVAAIGMGSDNGTADDHSSVPVHADHCLSHVAGSLSRDIATVPALFGTRAFGLRQDRPLMRVAMLSPFKPPKA